MKTVAMLTVRCTRCNTSTQHLVELCVQQGKSEEDGELWPSAHGGTRPRDSFELKGAAALCGVRWASCETCCNWKSETNCKELRLWLFIRKHSLESAQLFPNQSLLRFSLLCRVHEAHFLPLPGIRSLWTQTWPHKLTCQRLLGRITAECNRATVPILHPASETYPFRQLM